MVLWHVPFWSWPAGGGLLALSMGTLTTGVVTYAAAPSGRVSAITIGSLVGASVMATMVAMGGGFTLAGMHVAMSVPLVYVVRRFVRDSDVRLAVAAAFFQTTGMMLGGAMKAMAAWGT